MRCQWFWTARSCQLFLLSVGNFQEKRHAVKLWSNWSAMLKWPLLPIWMELGFTVQTPHFSTKSKKEIWEMSLLISKGWKQGLLSVAYICDWHPLAHHQLIFPFCRGEQILCSLFPPQFNAPILVHLHSVVSKIQESFPSGESPNQ